MRLSIRLSITTTIITLSKDGNYKFEQLHFDISELFARQLLVVFNSKTYDANWRDEITGLFAGVIKDVHAMQDKYDEETNHSKIKAKQTEWELYIKKQLDDNPPIN